MPDGGKGDTPRPLGVSMEEFDNNFDAIFGEKKKNTEPIPFMGHVDVDIEVSNDEQSVTVTKTWEL